MLLESVTILEPGRLDRGWNVSGDYTELIIIWLNPILLLIGDFFTHTHRLGGFATISEIDLKASEKFLAQFYLPKSELNKLPDAKAGECRERQLRALDCGAGIGRITKNLLLKVYI